MSLSAILLGLVNIGIVAVILLLVGAIIVWILGMLSFAIPANIQKLYLAIVALVVLYMLVALFFGFATWHVIHIGR